MPLRLRSPVSSAAALAASVSTVQCELTITASDAAEGERRFNALADGGQVQMPLAETFFASRFGMVADKFGVGWMILVEKK